MDKKIVIIGAGVAGINAATKLIDKGYSGDLITIIDKGSDPFKRKPEEVMTGMLGAGGWSDGKLTYHTAIGGQLSKYCGEEKAMELMKQVVDNFTRFHPKPEEIFCSDPQEEPEFIKPYFGLRMFPVWHIGSNYLHLIACKWYEYLLSKGVNFMWNQEVSDILFKENLICLKHTSKEDWIFYDKLIFAVGKSGIDFAQKLADEYKLPDEPKSVQIGVRFEAPQKYFQKLIDVSYDFKLYQKHYPKIIFPEGKPEDEYKKEWEYLTGLDLNTIITQKQEEHSVSIRSFCTNNNAAYVAVEETYGDITYNGHAKKGEQFRNNMTNFGILMEIKGIEDPFTWSREVVQKCQIDVPQFKFKAGIYYSPNITRNPSLTSEGNKVNSFQITHGEGGYNKIKEAFGGHFEYIENFISDMNKVFEFGDDWGMYIPEVKYLSPEPLVNYDNLSLNQYPNVHFVGDALSARGITVSGAHGIYVAEAIIRGF